MIASLRGTLVRKDPAGFVVVDTGPVGYRVFVSLSTLLALPEAGGDVLLNTVTIVREDAMHLYGFADLDEMRLFSLLLQVKGVGPKLALALLGGLKPAELAGAISRQDAGWISTVPGIGRKTAERIILELKEKVTALPDSTQGMPSGSSERLVSDAVSALVNLGYRASDSRSAVRKALQAGGPPPAIDELIRSSLTLLSGRNG